MKHFLILLTFSLILTACGGGSPTNGTGPKTDSAPSKMTAKVGDKDRSFEIKDAVVLDSTLPYLDKDGKDLKMGQHTIVLGSYSFEGQPARTVPDGQTKVALTLNSNVTADGSELKIKTGTYATGQNGPMSVSSNNIVFIENGKEVQNYKTYGFKGDVKITSVEGDTVKGELDLTADGGHQVKGQFTAKIKKS